MDSSEAPSPRTAAASGAARGALVVATWTLALEAFLAGSWRRLGDPFHFVGLALLVIEGWTRPLDAPETGLAHPAMRRWMFRALTVWTVALATYADLS